MKKKAQARIKTAFDGLRLKWLPVVEDGVLDPLRVADMHRRGAYRPSDDFIVHEISETLYRLGCAMTHLGTGMPFSHKSHDPVTKMVAVHLFDLAARARVAGASSVLLPLPDKTPFATYMKHVLKVCDVGIPFSFRTEPYSLDLSASGKINPALTKNALYKGADGFATIIGLWEIDPDLKRRWDASLRRPGKGRAAAP